MKNILVTGGAGNIGGSLVKRLVEDPDNFVVVVDNLFTGSIKKLPDNQSANWKFIRCDVNDFEDISYVLSSYHFDYVFHYAAVVGVERTLYNPMLVLKDIDGIRNILRLSKNTGVKRIFYSSSSEVYGEPVEVPQNESTTPLNSRLPYAIVKNVGEAYFRSFNLEFGLDYTIFRFFNTYGPMQSTDFVIPKFIDAAIKNNPITVYGDGSQSRTFFYIDDNIDFTLKTLKENHFVNDIVNVGSDFEISILKLAQLVKEVLKSESKIVHLSPLQEGDMRRRHPNISKMKKVLSRELTSLEYGIRAVADSLEKASPAGTGRRI